MNRTKTAIAALAIIAVGLATAIIIYVTRPKAERKKPPRMTPIVETSEICRENRTAELELMGMVLPAESVELKPRVAGEIVYVHDNWIEGGTVKKGETIIRLEDADYRISLEQAESELALELGRQDIAKQEWKMIGIKNPSKTDRELALREPQLKSARARVEQARLNRDRTEIKAPFNAVITQRNLNRGDQATTQLALGTLVNTDRYHVRVSLPVENLQWIDLPNGSTPGSDAVVHLPDGKTRDGHVLGLLPDLEEEGRMARCLVEIKDPIRENSSALLNSFVRVTIKGKTIEDSFCIERNYFRDNSCIWLFTKDKTLKVMPVEPIWSDRRRVFFRTEIPEGAKLITSSLSVVIDGTALRTAEDGEIKSAEKEKPANE